MSMNLCFDTKVGGHYIDFPYQTSTEITFKVVNEQNIEKRLKTIRDDIDSFSNDADANELYTKCESMLKDDTLVLTYI